jgi:thiamine biosynthesis lipoprotein
MKLDQPLQSKRTGLSRREFLRIVAVSAAAGLALKGGWDTINRIEQISETRMLMGTLVNITIVGADAAEAQVAIRASLDRMTTLEKMLSRFQSNSQLSQLNQIGYLEHANPEFLKLLAISTQVSQLSGGAFDITVKPLVDVYFDAFTTTHQLPSKNEIERAQALIDYKQLSVKGDSVSFTCPGMSITLDGIAKGYIVDEGVARLRTSGFANVFVEAGGDLLASGGPRPGELWKIGIKSPRASQPGMLARMSVNNRAVATSGDYMQSFTTDFSHNHIIDPRSGYSCRELASATIVSGSTALADALATAVMVMGAAQGKELVESLSSCEALLITKELEIVHTGGFPIL